MNYKKLLTFLFFCAFFCLGISFFHNAYAGIEILKMNEIVDWDKASNYAEAKQIMQMAKEINHEKRRRKQLRDAGVPEEEIKKIIRNERIAKMNNNVLTQDKQKDKKILNNNNRADDNEEESDENVKNDSDRNNGNRMEKRDEEGNNTIINNYDTYGSVEKQNNQIHKRINFEDRNDDDNDVIDLSIVPKVPTLEHRNYPSINYNAVQGGYDDFELSRMLQKAGENANNPQHFAIFAKEVAKIANGKKKEKILPIPDIEEYIEDDDLYATLGRSGKHYATNRNKNRGVNYFYKNKNNNGRYKKDNNYKTNLHNLYATAQEEFEKKKNNVGEKNTSKKQIRYALGEDDKNNTDENIVNQEIVLNTNRISKKQIDAKNLGAPHPTKRTDNNHLKQYQPQNISQIAYDKNNKHLQPVVFEKHIIDQVFDNLGSDNAIPLARALINKFGKTDIADDDGNTLLMHAVARKNQSLIAMLLAEGASPNVLNKEGFAPIHLASSNGDNIAVHSLMMSGGNPNLMDNSGNTPLMYATKMCDSGSVKMMMALGGDPNIINKSTGKTAMDFAYENENPMMHELLESEAKKLNNKRKPINLVGH